MKYWQLRSVIRDAAPFTCVAQSNRDWQEFLSWLDNEASIVQIQDRAKLDYELPDPFVQAVLEQSGLSCYLSNDGWLRSYQASPQDEVLAIREAFERFGGEKLEEAWEKGSVDISGISAGSIKPEA